MAPSPGSGKSGAGTATAVCAGASSRCRETPQTIATTPMVAVAQTSLSSGWKSVTKDSAAIATRARKSAPTLRKNRPNIANATPQVPLVTTKTSMIWPQPGFSTRSERVKIANVIRVIGAQILSASYMVRMNDVFAIRAETAAVSDVGGESSPHTERKNTKKCATHGSMPSFIIGGTMMTAPMM